MGDSTIPAIEVLFLGDKLTKHEKALSKYNSYPTNLILLHKFNSLPIEFKSIILYSTLHNWSKRDVANIIGSDTLADKDIKLLKQIITHRRLLTAAKALYFLFSTVSKLFKDADNKAELLKLHKSSILQTISRVKSTLGVKRALRWIGISPNQLYYWIETKNCQLSFLDLCRSRNPHQLLGSEVKVIKDYLLDDCFGNWSALSIYYQALRDKAVYMGMGT